MEHRKTFNITVDDSKWTVPGRIKLCAKIALYVWRTTKP